MAPRPAKKIKPAVIPRVAQPTAFYGDIFAVGSIEPLFIDAGLSLPSNADRSEIASILDSTATAFIYGSVVLASDTPGKKAAWARQVEERTAALLSCFKSTVDSSDPVSTAARILRGPSGFIEQGGVLFEPEATLSRLLPAVRSLVQGAGLAATAYEARKGARRQMPVLELDLYAGLARAYFVAFGRDWTLAPGPQGKRSGPAVQFCMAVGRHLEGQPIEVNRSRADGIKKAFIRLRSANGNFDRIRDIINGGLGRKR